MKSKKSVISVLFFLALVMISGCKAQTSEQDNSWKKVSKSNQLTVATAGTLFPASYHDKNNQLTGYDVEVIKEVAKRLDLNVTFKESNIDGMLAALQNGSADLAANDFSLNKTRSKKFVLSSPIKYSFGSMVVRKSDDSGIQSLKDLKGKKAAGEATTNYMKIAEKFGAKLVSYDNATNDQYLTDVANGRTDVILNDYYLQKMALGALPDVPVKILKDVYYNPTHSGFLLKKENQALRKKINQTIKEMQEDGTLTKISQKFFYADVTKKPNIEIKTTVDVN